jgi:hypothetical protein
MDATESEWDIYYDDTGRRLTAHPPDETWAELRRLRALGLGWTIDKGVPLSHETWLLG